MQCFVLSFEMSFTAVAPTHFLCRFCGSEIGGVHSQGITNVANWVLVPGPGFFLGLQNMAVNSPGACNDVRFRASPPVCSLSLSPSQFLILEDGDREHTAHQLPCIYHLQNKSSQLLLLPPLRCKREPVLLLHIITLNS